MVAVMALTVLSLMGALGAFAMLSGLPMLLVRHSKPMIYQP